MEVISVYLKVIHTKTLLSVDFEVNMSLFYIILSFYYFHDLMYFFVPFTGKGLCFAFQPELVGSLGGLDKQSFRKRL